MKRRYLPTILFVAVLLSAGSYILVRSNRDLARAAPPPRPPSDAPWSVNVKVNDDPGTAKQRSPSIAVDANGNAYAVWQDRRNDDGDIYFSYRPVGGSWSANVKVNDDPGTAIQLSPAIAVDSSGNACAVWADWRNGNVDIYFSYRPTGGSWGANLRVNDDALGASQWSPSIAVDGSGNAYAVWRDGRNDIGDVYFSYRPAGGSWGANARVNDDAGTAWQWAPSIAVDASANAYAVWEDERNDTGDIYFSYRPAGGAWEANVRVNDDAGTPSQSAPAIAVDSSGNAYAVWDDSRNEHSDIYFSYRPAYGAWDANVKVNDDAGTGNQGSPAIAVDSSGNAYAIWRDRGNDYWGDIYFSYRPAGGGWGANVRVNDDAGTAEQDAPSIAVDASRNAYALWRDLRNDPDATCDPTTCVDDIYFSYRPAGVEPTPTPTPTPIPECQESDNGLNTCDLEEGDILIHRATGLLYIGERALYKGYWGHTGMYYGDGWVIHSYADWYWPVTYPGVTIEPISATGFWTTEDWVVLRLKDQYDHGNELEALVYAGAHFGDPYNHNFLHPEYDGTYYCTSLVWRSFLEADSAIDLNTNTTVCNRLFQSFCDRAIIPDDIYRSPFLDHVTARAIYKRAVFYLGSPADFYVTDPQGRHVGVDPVTGLVVNEMPNEVFYTGPDAELEFIAIVDMEGTWNVQVVGTDTGEYTFVIEAVDRVQPRTETVTGTTSPGQIDEYQVDYPSYSVYLPLIFKDY